MPRLHSKATGWTDTGAPGFTAAMKEVCTISRPPGSATHMIAKVQKAASTRIRFETGPASVVRLSSRTILRKLRVITGVGLAQPTRKPLKKLNPMKGPKMMSPGNSKVPIGST